MSITSTSRSMAIPGASSRSCLSELSADQPTRNIAPYEVGGCYKNWFNTPPPITKTHPFIVLQKLTSSAYCRNTPLHHIAKTHPSPYCKNSPARPLQKHTPSPYCKNSPLPLAETHPFTVLQKATPSPYCKTHPAYCRNTPLHHIAKSHPSYYYKNTPLYHIAETHPFKSITSNKS